MSDLKNSKPSETVSTRVDKETKDKIDFAAKFFETNRGDISRQLLTKAVQTVFKNDEKLRKAYERRKEQR